MYPHILIQGGSQQKVMEGQKGKKKYGREIDPFPWSMSLSAAATEFL